MQFVNRDTGWVCGFDGMFGGVWRTTDGGYNWSRQYTSPTNGLDKIFFLKEKVNGEYWGWTFKLDILFKTSNSGVSWVSIPGGIGGGCGSSTDMYFIDTARGVVTRNFSCFNVTTDGGYNWTNVYEYASVNSRIGMGSVDIGWMTLGTDSIIKTFNFFESYGKQTLPANTRHIFALDTLLAYGVSLNQMFVVKTTNGGGNIVSVNNISSEVPEKFELYQNYPNPFNPSTNIKYQIIKASLVILKVYDALGKEVITLVNEFQKPGTYKVSWDASGYSSGLYIYTLEADGFRDTKKTILIK
jgi:Secretion system C-terminal sorting domain